MSPKIYRPKVQRETVRETMREMIQTKTGAKIGKKTFEKILRSNEKLRDLTHEGSMKEHEVGETYHHFIKTVKANPRIKIRMEAAKSLLYNEEVTDLKTKKFYGKVAGKENDAEKKIGPTPQEKKEAARIAERLKGYHRYSTLRDRMKGERYSVDNPDRPKTSVSDLGQPGAKQPAKGTPAKSGNFRPPSISAGAPRVAQHATSDNDLPFQDLSPQPQAPQKETAAPVVQKDDDADDMDLAASPPSEPIDMEIG